MTLVFLVRHAHSTANEENILSGRLSGVHLSEKGKAQARALSTRLSDLPLKALRTSPLDRCIESISPWFKRTIQTDSNSKLVLKIDEDLVEADYGTWSGRKLRALSKDPLWKDIQKRPSRVTFPRGESISAMQLRGIRAVENSLKVRGKGHILLVSHGDVIKSILAHALAMNLDDFQRIVIDPASVSVLDFSNSTPRVLLLNDTRSKLSGGALFGRSKVALVGGGSGTPAKERAK